MMPATEKQLHGRAQTTTGVTHWYPRRYKRPSFGLQKATFCDVKGGLLKAKRPPFIFSDMTCRPQTQFFPRSNSFSATRSASVIFGVGTSLMRTTSSTPQV